MSPFMVELDDVLTVVAHKPGYSFQMGSGRGGSYASGASS